MKSQSGMTLIEVMVALVVFALAGLSVMQATLQQTNHLGRMEEKTLAGWLADNQLIQLKLENRWPALSPRKRRSRRQAAAGTSAGRASKPSSRSCERWTSRSAMTKATRLRSPRCAPG